MHLSAYVLDGKALHTFWKLQSSWYGLGCCCCGKQAPETLSMFFCQAYKYADLQLQADEGPQLYWQFLDSLELSETAAAGAGNGSSSSMCWNSIIDQASALCLPQVAKVRAWADPC